MQLINVISKEVIFKTDNNELTVEELFKLTTTVLSFVCDDQKKDCGFGMLEFTFKNRPDNHEYTIQWYPNTDCTELHKIFLYIDGKSGERTALSDHTYGFQVYLVNAICDECGLDCIVVENNDTEIFKNNQQEKTIVGGVVTIKYYGEYNKETHSETVVATKNTTHEMLEQTANSLSQEGDTRYNFTFANGKRTADKNVNPKNVYSVTLTENGNIKNIETFVDYITAIEYFEKLRKQVSANAKEKTGGYGVVRYIENCYYIKDDNGNEHEVRLIATKMHEKPMLNKTFGIHVFADLALAPEEMIEDQNALADFYEKCNDGDTEKAKEILMKYMSNFTWLLDEGKNVKITL